MKMIIIRIIIYCSITVCIISPPRLRLSRGNDNCPQTSAAATIFIQRQRQKDALNQGQRQKTMTTAHRHWPLQLEFLTQKQIVTDKQTKTKTNCQRQNDALNQGQRQKTMTTAHVHRPLQHLFLFLRQIDKDKQSQI